MTARHAPILQAIAGRMAGEPPALMRTDPVRWAYALRDAVALAEPDVVVSHADPALEADALLAGLDADAGDWVDRLLAAPELATLPPASAAVELVRTLAGIYRAGPPVAATLTGPVTTAARLAGDLLGGEASEDDRIELADLVADKLAGLVGAYAAAGAAFVAILEPDTAFLPAPPDRAAALLPIERAAAHLRLGDAGALQIADLPADTPLEHLRRAPA